MTSITFIVPTLGRESLGATLKSIKARPGDEILVIGNVRDSESLIDDITFRSISHPPGGDYGHTERNFATPFAKGRYICHIDDDDIYAPGTRAVLADAIEGTPDRPVIFRMRAPNGVTLWQEKVIRCGNVGTPTFLLPNKQEMFGRWEPFVGGDCAFLEGCKWKAEDYVWREEVICLVGHNWG